ncbi:PAAR domain-containing protein [Pseudoduganella danionis]|uniref:PAAR domain-containing protein n=1 Tax=Pseudoduganella danionis TaxID=1890295 RepID=A0ABW9SI03_9BURK|nr:PAAR domain-containing protein [Pseudoduganella danionis]MTW31727.1 hypothetical protein [Pseudoduganella danionis]
MRRYNITVGAKTTAGGVVQATTTPAMISGTRIAVEGDTIYCPKCKKTGTIVCISPRHKQHIQGKNCALSDDICSCGCFPPPRLLASQTVRYQSFLSEQNFQNSSASIATLLVASEIKDFVPEELEQYFIATRDDQETPNLTYVIHEDGVVLDRGMFGTDSKTKAFSIHQDLQFTCWANPT